jgi:hypothetical protein
MTDREPELDKRIVQLPDGRRLIYYRFPDEPALGEGVPAQSETGAEDRPQREER